jgi:DNA-binding protein H-NS
MSDEAQAAARTPFEEKLAGLSEESLTQLWTQVDREISRRRTVAQLEATEAERLERAARREELAARNAARPVADKSGRRSHADIEVGDVVYRSNQNADDIWRGLGRHPKWLTAILADGQVTIDDLRHVWTTENAAKAAENSALEM